MLRLTVCRQSRGWSRTELGFRARIHPARVGKIENGWVRPYPRELARLAEALEWPGCLEDLLKEVTEGEVAR